ncbi:uncharacterized protein VNE69_03098 [Vairimorpha necatrix]|uniref:Uncharacterized protein n=1 Tax=Vairimorpha necatrix TaxID=6039 RepID=A0AAX4JA75_9MICR
MGLKRKSDSFIGSLISLFRRQLAQQLEVLNNLENIYDKKIKRIRFIRSNNGINFETFNEVRIEMNVVKLAETNKAYVYIALLIELQKGISRYGRQKNHLKNKLKRLIKEYTEV